MNTGNRERTQQTVAKAAAMRYRAETDTAPVVLASGRDELARRIVEIAVEHGITVYEDPELVELLLALDIGSEIPNELYQAAADALAFVSRCRT